MESVVDALVAAARPLLPLRVRTAEYTDPIPFVMEGDWWSFAISCPWTWERPDQPDVADGDEHAADGVWDLCGLDIVAVTPALSSSVEFSLGLSDGGRLVIKPDTDWEPWSFQHDDLTMVFVGTGPSA